MPRKKAAKPKVPLVVGEGAGKCLRCSREFDKTTSMGEWTFDAKTGKWTCPRCSLKIRSLKQLKKTDRRGYMVALSCSCGALDDTYKEVRSHAKNCKVPR